MDGSTGRSISILSGWNIVRDGSRKINKRETSYVMITAEGI
jgi:hypothetical protein